MSTDDNAQELAARAANQAKNASKNTGRAVKAVAEPAIEDAVEEIRDNVEKLEDTVRQVNPRMLGRISNDVGVGFLALSVSIYAGVIAANKFRGVFAGGNQVLSD